MRPAHRRTAGGIWRPGRPPPTGWRRRRTTWSAAVRHRAGGAGAGASQPAPTASASPIRNGAVVGSACTGAIPVVLATMLRYRAVPGPARPGPQRPRRWPPGARRRSRRGRQRRRAAARRNSSSRNGPSATTSIHLAGEARSPARCQERAASVVVDRQGGVGVACLGDGLGQAHGQQDPTQTVGPPPLDDASAKQCRWHPEQRAEGHGTRDEPLRRHAPGHRQPDRGQPQQPRQPACRPGGQAPDLRGWLSCLTCAGPLTVPLPHACSPPHPRRRCPTNLAPAPYRHRYGAGRWRERNGSSHALVTSAAAPSPGGCRCAEAERPTRVCGSIRPDRGQAGAPQAAHHPWSPSCNTCPCVLLG